ncbi:MULTISPECIES: YugN family protein [Bhargavaea]|uniref:YugN family protein n=1 Tax=Bhargavaea changchunensis TaxID=2134037 RepID=A0ABW2NCQ6_9BACL|nr:YugN family protein [Bhargavaea sp. CC-171006]
MYFENTGIEGVAADLQLLDDIMNKHGLIRAEQWDYERVSYDKKIVIKEGTYYLRVFGYTTDGDVGARDAVINLKKPVIGKHYYPHGVEYGEDEYFPDYLLENCTQTLLALKEDLKPYELQR